MTKIERLILHLNFFYYYYFLRIHLDLFSFNISFLFISFYQNNVWKKDLPTWTSCAISSMSRKWEKHTICIEAIYVGVVFLVPQASKWGIW